VTTEQAPAEFQDLRAAATFLVRHWREELDSLSRETLGRLVDRPEPQLVVLAGANHVIIGHDDQGQIVELARVLRDEAAPRALASTLARLGLLGSDITLSVPDADALRPTVRLPSARKNVLVGALGYELEQLTPLDPAELYYDYALGERDRASNTTLIGLRIIRKEIVDSAATLCHAAGLRIAAIGFANDPREADWRRFPVDQAARRRRLWRRHGSAALGGLAALLFAMLVFAAFARGSAEVDALNDKVANEGQQAALVEHIGREVTATRREFAALVREKREPLAVAVLADLTRLLPDGTWLSDVAIDGRKVRIQGNSPAASELIAIIDSSGKFANAQFEAPVVQDTALHAEHFSMVFDVVEPAR
jgi:general secretion pathway protein L